MCTRGTKLFLKNYSELELFYNHSIFDSSFEKKILSVSKLRMANNLFASSELIDFKNRFSKYLKHPHLHFTSTGALAVEAGMKAALYKKKIKAGLSVIQLQLGWSLIKKERCSYTKICQVTD